MAEKEVTINRAIRSEEHPYFPTARKSAQDINLSYEAAGMLWYLLSKPDTWKIIPSTLQRKTTKRGKVYKLISELIEKGYVERTYNRDAKGKVVDVQYKVNEEAKPLPANPEMAQQEMGLQDMGKQDMGKQHNRNNRVVESTDKKKKDTALKSTAQIDAADQAEEFLEVVIATNPLPSKPEEAKPAAKLDSHEQPERNRLFDGVALTCWGIDLKKIKTKLSKPTATRIGLIVSWLKEREHTPEQLWEWANWYRENKKGMAFPRGIVTFETNWLEWESSKGNTHIARSPDSALPEYDPTNDPVHKVIPPEKRIDPEELKRRIEATYVKRF